MLARVLSCAVIGLDGELVEVEVDISRGALPTTTIVTLPQPCTSPNADASSFTSAPP